MTLVLPNFAFNSLGSPTTRGCSNTSFTVQGSNSGTSAATLILTAGTATLNAHQLCMVIIPSGVTTAPEPQDPNLYTRTAAISLSSPTYGSIGTVFIDPSTATAHPALSMSRLAALIPAASAVTPLAYTFKLSAPLESGDSIALTLPTWKIASPSGITTSPGCGLTGFTATGANPGAGRPRRTAVARVWPATREPGRIIEARRCVRRAAGSGRPHR